MKKSLLLISSLAIGSLALLIGFVGLLLGVWLYFGSTPDIGIWQTLTGRLWIGIDPPSLTLTQAVVERYVSSGLWHWGIAHLLLLPFYQYGLIVLGMFVFGLFGCLSLRLVFLRKRHSRL